MEVGEQHLAGPKQAGFRQLRLLDLDDQRGVLEQGLLGRGDLGAGLSILLVGIAAADSG